MNGTNRYTNLSFSTLRDLPHLQLPYEQLDQLLSSYEEKANKTKQMLDVAPKYIQESKADVDLASQVANYQTELKEKLTGIAKKGNVREYMQGLDEAQTMIKDLYSPGGAGNLLQSRFDAYQSEMKRITEKTEDFVNPIYRRYYQNELMQQIKNEKASDIYSTATRRGKSIGSVNIGKEVIITKEVDEYLKGWAADKNVDITKFIENGRLNNYYYKMVSEKSVEALELQNALEQFYEAPHIKHALNVESWGISQNYSEDGKIKLVEDSKTVMDLKFETAREKTIKELNAKRGNLTKEELAGLKKQGYESFEAFEEAVLKKIAEQKKQLEAEKQSLTFEGIIEDSVKAKYSKAYIPKYAFTEEEIDLIVNAPAMERLKYDNKLAYTQKIIEQFAQPSPTLITSSKVQTEKVSNIAKRSKDSYDNYRNTLLKLNSQKTTERIINNLKTFGFSSTEDFDYEVASGLSRAYTESLDKEGKFQKEIFIAKIKEVKGFNNKTSVWNNFAWKDIFASDSIKADEIAEFISQENVRNNLQEYISAVKDSYEVYKLNLESAYQAIDSLPTNDEGKIELVSDTVTGFTMVGTVEVPESDKIKTTKRELKDKAKRGMLNSSLFPADMEVNFTITGLYNDALNQNNTLVLESMNSSLEAIIGRNLNNLTEENLNSLGYDRELKPLDDKQQGIKKVSLGVKNINGINQIVFIAEGKNGGNSMVLDSSFIDGKNFLQNHVTTLIGTTMNEKGEIIDDETYNTLATLYYDLTKKSTPINTHDLSDRLERGTEKTFKVGILSDFSNNDVILKVVTLETGNNYLISYPSSQEADINEMFDDYGYFNLRRFNGNESNNPFREVVQIDSSIDGVNKAIAQTKASWIMPDIQSIQPNKTKNVKVIPDELQKFIISSTGMIETINQE